MNMDSNYIDFIGMYKNVYPDGFCNHLIEEFERLLVSGACSNRQEIENVPKTRKEDFNYFMNIRNNPMSSFNDVYVVDIFLNGLQNCFDDYTDKFDILKNNMLRCTSLKMQKTDPGAGYHIWHAEQGPDSDAARCLVFSAYLNTIKDAGETEFLYQKIRIPPEENTLVIWPAAFTHTHRGNVVHGEKSKYIVTGWFYIE
jgi:hypothetical protein